MKLLVAVAAVVSVFVTSSLNAQERSKTLSAAVDAQGVRHWASDYPRKWPPWADQELTKFKPQYPFTERAQHHTGSGLFRLNLSLKTGAVTKITALRSTGFPELDRAATDAFSRWRWKPGTWREIDVPITFSMYQGR